MNIDNYIKSKYGGKKAMLYYYYYLILSRMGLFRKYKNLDWSRINRVVFVCKGNICRSPYAEKRALQLGITSASVGLDTRTGSPANQSAISNAHNRGINLQKHKATLLQDFTINEKDLLVGMEPYHGEKLIEIATQTGAQITLLGLWAEHDNPYIHDPYGANDNYFQRCFTLIDRGISRLQNHLNSPCT